jgi:hypothetical protein
MRTLVSIFAAFAVAGCISPGMEFRKPMTVTRADGTTSAKSVKVASFAVEFVGLKKFSINYLTGDVTIEFQENILRAEQYAVQNAKGELVGTLSRDIVPGIYTARVIEAYGLAGKQWIDATGSLITGALLSGTVPVGLGNGLRAIPIKL